MSTSDTRLVEFAQARINRIADAIDGLAEQIRRTNTHVERLNREVGALRGEVSELRGEVSASRSDMRTGLDRVDLQMRDIHSEVIPKANLIITAQQQAMRAMMRLDEIEQRPDEPTP